MCFADEDFTGYPGKAGICRRGQADLLGGGDHHRKKGVNIQRLFQTGGEVKLCTGFKMGGGSSEKLLGAASCAGGRRGDGGQRGTRHHSFGEWFQG